MKLGEVTHYNLKSETILAEGWQDLNEAQRRYVGKWERDVWPLVEGLNKLLEADLDPKQIDQIFTNAEKVAIDSGNNKTALGKAGSVVGDQATKLQKQISDLMTAAQNSGPIKNFDAQFEKLKAQLKKKLQGNPAGQKILKMVDGYQGFAKENPAKAAFVIGAMTSVLAFASGGIVSGAAIGFFLKLANNTLKGDKLSTALAKGVKGAAIGAIAGAIGDSITAVADDTFPADVTQIFTNGNGEIDITQVAAMADGVGIEDLDSGSVAEFVQTRNALMELYKSTDLDAEAQEVLQQQIDQVQDKLFDLMPPEFNGNAAAAVDLLQDKFNIEGQGVDIVVKTNVSNITIDANDLPGEDGVDGIPDDSGDADVGGTGGNEPEVAPNTDADGNEIGDEGTVVDSKSADEMNDAGINSADIQPSTQISELGGEANLTDAEIEKLQSVYKLDRAIENAKFMGTRISASSDMQVWDNIPTEVDGVEGTYEAGQTFTSEISTAPSGIDGPWTASVSTEISGVDADGNAVYAVKKVFISPNVMDQEFFDIIDKLSPEMRDKMMDSFDAFRETESMETLVDDFKQEFAEKLMQAVAVTALGGALAATEVTDKDGKILTGNAPAKKEESIERHNQMIYEYVEYLEETMTEGPALDKMKNIAMAGVKKAGDLTQAGLKQVGKGMDKAGAAVAGGIGKTAKGIKSQAKQLGNKITKEKLMKMWNKMGKPTDTGSVINILSDAGMDDESIGTVGTQSKVELKPVPKDDDAGAPEGGAGTDPKDPKDPKDPNAPPGGEPVDANKDGKDDNTGKPIAKPVDANKDGKDDNTGKPIPKTPAGGTTPGTAADKARARMAQAKAGKAGAGAGGGASATPNANLTTLADKIKKAGVADQVKTQLSAPPKAGGGSDLGSGIKMDLPTLAQKISDAGMQQTVKQQLTQPQTQKA